MLIRYVQNRLGLDACITTLDFHYRKIPKISPGLIFGQSSFFGPPKNKPRAYLWRAYFRMDFCVFKITGLILNYVK